MKSRGLEPKSDLPLSNFKRSHGVRIEELKRELKCVRVRVCTVWEENRLVGRDREPSSKSPLVYLSPSALYLRPKAAKKSDGMLDKEGEKKRTESGRWRVRGTAVWKPLSVCAASVPSCGAAGCPSQPIQKRVCGSAGVCVRFFTDVLEQNPLGSADPCCHWRTFDKQQALVRALSN